MNKTYFFISVILAMSLIGQIRFFEDYLSAGDELEAYINVKNPYAHELEDIEIALMSYDLGISAERNPFELLGGDRVGKTIWTEIPEQAVPGDYMVRITAKSGNKRSVKHRYITII